MTELNEIERAKVDAFIKKNVEKCNNCNENNFLEGSISMLSQIDLETKNVITKAIIVLPLTCNECGVMTFINVGSMNK